MLGEVDEAKAARLAVAVLHDHGRLDLAVGREHAHQLLIVVDFGGERLDEDVGEGGVGGGARFGAVLARNEEADEDLLAVEEHAVHLGHSELSGVLRLVMYEAVSLGATQIIGGDLAREDVAKGREGVIERLVIDRLVKVLDEHVARA